MDETPDLVNWRTSSTLLEPPLACPSPCLQCDA
jgi:hypothetical protein